MKKLITILCAGLLTIGLSAQTNQSQNLKLMLAANKIQKCLGAFKQGYKQYSNDYTINNCPNGWNCRMNVGTANCLGDAKNSMGNSMFSEAIDWLKNNPSECGRWKCDELVDYWNDNNKVGQDID